MIKFFQEPYMFLLFVLLGGFVTFLIKGLTPFILIGLLIGGLAFILLDMIVRAFVNS